MKSKAAGVGIWTLIVTVLAFAVAYHFSVISDIRAADNAKVNGLQFELEDARSDRDHFEDLLRETPGTIPAYEEILKKKDLEIRDLKKQLEKQGVMPIEGYVFSEKISVGQSLIDAKTGLILGLISIDRNYPSTEFVTKISLKLPDREQIILDNITTGKYWDFSFAEKKYRVVITNVNWYSDSIEISIRSL